MEVLLGSQDATEIPGMKDEIPEITTFMSRVPDCLIKMDFQKELGSNHLWRGRRGERREIENYIVQIGRAHV